MPSCQGPRPPRMSTVAMTDVTLGYTRSTRVQQEQIAADAHLRRAEDKGGLSVGAERDATRAPSKRHAHRKTGEEQHNRSPRYSKRQSGMDACWVEREPRRTADCGRQNQLSLSLSSLLVRSDARDFLDGQNALTAMTIQAPGGDTHDPPARVRHAGRARYRDLTRCHHSSAQR